jgi:hypothetical protein
MARFITTNQQAMPTTREVLTCNQSMALLIACGYVNKGVNVYELSQAPRASKG